MHVLWVPPPSSWVPWPCSLQRTLYLNLITLHFLRTPFLQVSPLFPWVFSVSFTAAFFYKVYKCALISPTLKNMKASPTSFHPIFQLSSKCSQFSSLFPILTSSVSSSSQAPVAFLLPNIIVISLWLSHLTSQHCWPIIPFFKPLSSLWHWWHTLLRFPFISKATTLIVSLSILHL